MDFDVKMEDNYWNNPKQQEYSRVYIHSHAFKGLVLIKLMYLMQLLSHHRMTQNHIYVNKSIPFRATVPQTQIKQTRKGNVLTPFFG